MRVTYALGEMEHWVEVRDDVVWTRKLTRQLLEARITAASDTTRQMDQYITACSITDADGHEYTDWATIDDEVLDNLHPGVLEFVAWLPAHCKSAQAALGNVRGGRL
jgi:hypothetical protein